MEEGGGACVAVVGGAVAGAEVAGALADAGMRAVVFEQNPRPYGKIEDGLPRWHVELRKKEYERIRAHLERDEVEYVPLTRIGRDIPFPELVDGWGFGAVVLANGAWRDRPLPVEGADAWVGRGLVYQNPFIIWWNHAEEESYRGPRFEVRDDTLVVGGGLASIDVVKVLMLETTREVLRGRGIEVDVVELEVKGIPRTLAAHGLALGDLGLAGPTLFYRRQMRDMPLVEVPEGASPERVEKVMAGREKLLQKAMQKYCFSVEPLCMPDGLLVEKDRLVGLRFRRTEMVGGRPVPTDETFERRGSCVISSIGSIPEPIEGIRMQGELFDFADWDLGRLEAWPTVLSAGNIVTGKGNIVASRKHARQITSAMVEAFLGLGDGGRRAEAGLADALAERMREGARQIAAAVRERSRPGAGSRAALRERVAARQRAVGYDGDVAAWIARSLRSR